MKSMMQPKKGYIVAYYAKILFASNLCLLARGPPTQKYFIIFVVMNQI